jgi:hypothetical protein
MHGARYTSGTEFYLATGDIYATQQLPGHADVSNDRHHLRPRLSRRPQDKLRKVYGD